MRSVGLITEYNPFHNGHLHHLKESLRVTETQVAVAVMSGHFLQRGEPALVDKWVRAQMALRAGVDLVVELPFPWACNSAPYFALGAVQALSALGGIDTLCFGSETGDVESLDEAAALLLEREEDITRRTAELLRTGMNFPEARAAVFSELAARKLDTELLGTPNNILGIEYLKALRQTTSSIRPFAIPREGAGYHDEEASTGSIASATAIRRLIREGSDVSKYLPSQVYSPLQQALKKGLCLDVGLLHRILLSRILPGADTLRDLYQVESGIENRLFEVALDSDSYDFLVEEVKSRHLTRTRIQRIIAYILNDVKCQDMQDFLESGPLYLHVLACSEQGRAFLAHCRKTASIPIVSNYSRVYQALKRFYGAGTQLYELAQRMLKLELRATRNYTLLMRRWEGNRNRDFFEEVVLA